MKFTASEPTDQRLNAKGRNVSLPGEEDAEDVESQIQAKYKTSGQNSFGTSKQKCYPSCSGFATNGMRLSDTICFSCNISQGLPECLLYPVLIGFNQHRSNAEYDLTCILIDCQVRRSYFVLSRVVLYNKVMASI